MRKSSEKTVAKFKTENNVPYPKLVVSHAVER